MKLSAALTLATLAAGATAFAPQSATIARTSTTLLAEARPKIANNVLELIGHTPLVKLNKVTADCGAEIIAKLESSNPAPRHEDKSHPEKLYSLNRRLEIRVLGWPWWQHRRDIN